MTITGRWFTSLAVCKYALPLANSAATVCSDISLTLRRSHIASARLQGVREAYAC